ncbi:MAG: efflux transporter outer membrane subunit [Pseudomonadota bacterium]
MSRTSFLMTAATLVFAACEAVPGREEAAEIARNEIEDVPQYWQAAAARVGEVENGWIGAFNDPTLDALVEEAQLNNRNLRAAALNVERSWLLARQAGAELSPQVNLTTGGGGQGNFDGAGDSDFSVGVQAQWELDVWGRIRSGQQAAAESAEADEADYRFAQLSVAAAVARAYFAAINAEQQSLISSEIVDALNETGRIVEVRYDNGFATAQELALARADIASANDTFATAEQSKDSALRALEVLIGRYPAADLFVGLTLPSKPEDPPAGLPSELLERRPDLIAAERRIAATIDTVDQAKAARLPQISLTASAGGSSADLSSLLSPTNLAWTAASNLLVPLIDGGARRTQVEINTVEQQAAVETYADAALNAFSEVEQALADGLTIRRRKIFVEEAKVQSDEALRLAQVQYDEGETDLLSVLQLQQSAFAAESTVLTVNRLELDQYVDLNLALGGNWEDDDVL